MTTIQLRNSDIFKQLIQVLQRNLADKQYCLNKPVQEWLRETQKHVCEHY